MAKPKATIKSKDKPKSRPIKPVRPKSPVAISIPESRTFESLFQIHHKAGDELEKFPKSRKAGDSKDVMQDLSRVLEYTILPPVAAELQPFLISPQAVAKLTNPTMRPLHER